MHSTECRVALYDEEREDQDQEQMLRIRKWKDKYGGRRVASILDSKRERAVDTEGGRTDMPGGIRKWKWWMLFESKWKGGSEWWLYVGRRDL